MAPDEKGRGAGWLLPDDERTQDGAHTALRTIEAVSEKSAAAIPTNVLAAAHEKARREVGFGDALSIVLSKIDVDGIGLAAPSAVLGAARELGFKYDDAGDAALLAAELSAAAGGSGGVPYRELRALLETVTTRMAGGWTAVLYVRCCCRAANTVSLLPLVYCCCYCCTAVLLYCYSHHCTNNDSTTGTSSMRSSAAGRSGPGWSRRRPSGSSTRTSTGPSPTPSSGKR